MSGATLATASMAGTTLTNSGNQFATLVASNAGSGDIEFVNTGALTIAGIANSGGNIDIVNTGGISTTGPITAPSGNVMITACSTPPT